ncbi:MAG: hypothetical protein ACLQGP_24250 [Isosphaeraceae bacterium]
MSIDVEPSSEVEPERRRLIEEMVAESGPGWETQFQPGSFGCHELLDRTFLLADQIEKIILAHPSCFRDPQWYALASRAAESLHELYKRVGSEHV